MTGREKRRSLRAYWPLAIGVLVLAGYGALWRAGAGEMRRAIAEWAEDQRAEGLKVAFGDVSVSGFPFALRGSVRSAAIESAGGPAWRADALHIEASLFAPRRLAFAAPGTQTIDLGEAGVWRIIAPKGRARIAGGPAGLWTLDIRSGASRIERAGGPEAIETEETRLSIAPHKEDQSEIDAELALSGVAFSGASGPLRVEMLEAGIALAAAPVLAEGGGAAAWTAAGGALRIDRLFVEAEGAKLSATGTLSLDGEGYPAGLLKAEIVNPGGVATLLARAGALSQQEAVEARAALTLAAIAGGGKLSGPLVFKDGTAQIAGVALARLPRIDLDEAADQP